MRLPAETVPALLVAWMHRAPEAPALRTPRRAGGRTVSWGELGELVRHVTLGLVDDGLRSGQRVALAGTDGLAWRIADLAVLAAGGVRVAAAEGADRVLDLGPDPAALDAIDVLRTRGRALDDAEPDRFERTWRAVGPDDDAVEVTAADGDTLAFTHRAVVWSVRSLAQALSVDPGSRILASLPPSTVAGRVAGHLLALLTGGTAWSAGPDATPEDVAALSPHVVVGDRALWEGVAARLADHDPGRLRRALLERHRRTLAVPVDELGRAGRIERWVVARWVLPAVAADAGLAGSRAICLEFLPDRLLQELAGHGVLVRFGHADDRAGGVVALQREGASRPGTVGPPAPGVSLRSVDGSADDDADDGGSGRVAVRAGSVARDVADPGGWVPLAASGIDDGNLVVAGPPPRS